MPTREPDYNSSPSIPAISCPELTPDDLSHLDISKKENLKIEVSRYPQTRFWQVEVNDKLLAVVIYRRGALAIKEILESVANGNKGITNSPNIKKRKGGCCNQYPPPHLNYFVHVALREIVQQEPFEFFTGMAADNNRDLVEDIWQQVLEQCKKEGTPDNDASDIGIITMNIKKCPAVILTLPPPELTSDAFYVGIVMDGNKARYFTLELGVNKEGGDFPFLCEWQGDKHVRIKECPMNMSTEAFIKAVGERMGK